MIHYNHSNLWSIYDGLDRKAELFTRMLSIEDYLRKLILYLELDNLWYFKVEADASLFGVAVLESEVLVEGTSSDQKKIYSDLCHLVLLLIQYTNFKKLLPELVLCHLKIEFLVYFPLSIIEFTIRMSSLSARLVFRVNFSPSLTLKTGVAFAWVKNILHMDIFWVLHCLTRRERSNGGEA